MNSTTPRRLAWSIGTTACLVLAASAAPATVAGAFAADSIDGDVAVTSTETVSVRMDASGTVVNARVYEQLVLSGRGSVDISNPVPGGLRNLDGFGGWEVRDGVQRVTADVSGTQRYRSVADYDGDLPVEIDVDYRLDGKDVDASDLVGASGDLEVSYSVRNMTAEQQEVVFLDGSGQEQTRLQAVVIPMVGSLTTTLPSNFTEVRSAEANAAGDGKGGTSLSFTMTLFPPIGSDRATFGYTARIKDGVLPDANISLLPVNPLESPSFSGGADSYAAGAATGADLTAGATTIDGNLLKIRDGAADLVAGLLQLRDGAGELNAGLAGTAAPGAQALAAGAVKLRDGAGQLSAGTGDLTAGANKLNAGAGALAQGLKDAGAKAPALLGGLEELKAGLTLVDNGLTTLNGQVVPGAGQINTGATQLLGALDAQLLAGLDGALGALAAAGASAADLPDSLEKATIQGNVAGAVGAITQVRGGLDTTVRGGLTQIQGGSAQIRDGVDAQTSAGAAATDGTLKNGLARLLGGVGLLQTGGNDLLAGLGQLSAGANQLSAGTGDLAAGAGKLDAGAGTLAAGTGDLSSGAGRLADGLGDAADGSGRLADGLATAAGSAPALPEGAQTLSDQGTSQLINVGNATAMDYGLKYALIEASAARAGSAQPFGAPEGATALAAWRMTLAGESGEGSANVTRGIAAAVLIAAGLGVAALRRRPTA
ncbi:hypothetical protein HMPREF0063_10931 [Aeromicrobium marinum DSM 15272]|uniref:LPXTG-motif cell wall anchor domain protein n=1 Tax=Aeromicrobium marinum DSM 15272 TaxID=585531 RepID=E2SAE1_9ACTN|nr:hypothetical protein [Aeromicrobium marinum]EFQ84215.1 hypothetical protein HMPREF0063_10931 [Aeromicrobium marinum DSM 15272]